MIHLSLTVQGKIRKSRSKHLGNECKREHAGKAFRENE